jgi:hypothetical protein
MSRCFTQRELVFAGPGADGGALAAVAWAVFQWHGPRRCDDEVERHEQYQVEDRDTRTRALDAGDLGRSYFLNDGDSNRQTARRSSTETMQPANQRQIERFNEQLEEIAGSTESHSSTSIPSPRAAIASGIFFERRFSSIG